MLKARGQIEDVMFGQSDVVNHRVTTIYSVRVDYTAEGIHKYWSSFLLGDVLTDPYYRVKGPIISSL